MKMLSILLGLTVLATAGKAAFAAKGALEPLRLGSFAPDFKLKDVLTGDIVSINDFKGKKGLLVMFICRHCPYVQHVKKELARIGKEYQSKGLGIVAISSNDPVAYKEDAPESLKQMGVEEGFTFPFLFDDTQTVARDYTAAATPDMFLFDSAMKLVYRGQVDDTRPGGKAPSDGKDIRAAMEALLAGKPALSDQKPAVGCSIKWKKN